VQWTPVLLSEALLTHDVNMCLERPSGALPPDTAKEEVGHFFSATSGAVDFSKLLSCRAD